SSGSARGPAATGPATRPADHNGWYNHALPFTVSVTDNLSGVASQDANPTYSGPDSSSASVSASATDQAGNTGSGTSASFQYDATAPVVTVTANRAADHNGWDNPAPPFPGPATDNLSR